MQTSSHYSTCINLINIIMSVNGQINLTETDPTDPTGVYRTLQDCIAHRVVGHLAFTTKQYFIADFLSFQNHSLSMADEADDQGC